MKAEDGVYLLHIEKRKALTAAISRLLRVLEEEEDVLAEAFAACPRTERRHYRAVPVVPAAVVQPVRAGNGVHIRAKRD